jgi:polyisoprenyl-phosphate glycosyltransferase
LPLDHEEPFLKKISIVVPAYNEEACLIELKNRLCKVFEEEAKYNFEVIIIENGSTDNSWLICQEIARQDKRFKIIKFARNFKMDGGLTAGIEYAEGDACVLMAADLQDPPEVIPLMIREWENGYENIYAKIRKRNGTGPIRTFNSKAFYWLAGKLTDGRIPRNASDFRLVDKKVYKSVASMKERNRFVRGLFAWSGFTTKAIEIDRPERFGGVSNANTFGVLDLAFKGIFAHSYKPLKLITLFGLFLSGVSLLSLPFFFFIWVTRGVPFAGFGTIIAILILLISFLFLFLGVLGEYVGLIYEEVKERPNYLISETINLKGTDE